jgi:tripeptidyl-peptidase I
VKEWLLDCGIEEHELNYSSANDWITIALSVSVVEELLQTEYFVFKNREGVEIIRAPEWSIPEHLHSHIEAIQPTNSFFHATPGARQKHLQPRSPGKAPDKSNESGDVTDLNQLTEDLKDDPNMGLDLNNLPPNLRPDQACNASAVTPLCVRVLYGTVDYIAQAPEKNLMALNNFNDQFNNRSDISIYLRSYRPEAAGAAYTFETESIGGAINQQTPATPEQLAHGVGKEGNLDAQVLLGIGYPTKLLAYSTAHNPDSTDEDELYLNWLQHVLSQPTLPTVISTSYADPEDSLPYSYAVRVCSAFAQLGARGVTVIFGSGDHGVGTNSSSSCLPARTMVAPAHAPVWHGNHPSGREFEVHFPDSCPYITSVGATRLRPADAAAEVVAYNPANGFHSGGGFSKYFPRPAYQDDAVARYLAALGPLHSGFYNPGGRGYPDISAQGFRAATVWNGTKRLVDGTSASAPTVAAIVALVNDALLAQGKPPMGWLNPWLYGGGYKAFKDVVDGSASGCNGSGFPAMVGWDPVSGFGTPVSLYSVLQAQSCEG